MAPQILPWERIATIATKPAPKFTPAPKKSGGKGKGKAKEEDSEDESEDEDFGNKTKSAPKSKSAPKADKKRKVKELEAEDEETKSAPKSKPAPKSRDKKGKAKEVDAEDEEEIGKEYKRKPPKSTGKIRVPSCGRCVKRKQECIEQAGGRACLDCAGNKLKCVDFDGDISAPTARPSRSVPTRLPKTTAKAERKKAFNKDYARRHRGGEMSEGK